MAARRANARIKSRGQRGKARKANAAEQVIAFGVIGAAVAFLVRHPLYLVQVVAALLVVGTGLYYFDHSTTERPLKGVAGSEAKATPKPIPPAPSTASGARRDEASVVKSRSNEREASPPVKAPVQTGSMNAPRDAELDSWFIKAYLSCWTPPTTLPDGEKYAAQIRVVHNNDGSLAATPWLVNPPSDPAWRAFAESAIRAVTRCSPLKTPAQYQSRFDQWRKMTLYFSPDNAPD